jgi:hypothetical protein
MLRSVIRGSLGFGAVSVAAFSIWAFGGGRFGGELSLYAAIAGAFVILSGLILHPLVQGRWRFHFAFVPGFLLYAAVWCAAWFSLRSRTGEWIGSIAGSAVFAAWVCGVLGGWRAIPKAALILAATHSLGYFSGDAIWGLLKPSHPKAAALVWGLLYGFCFGAGFGYVFHAAQRKP